MTDDTTDAWPFVVSRNPMLDWRPIVAPPFLIDARADYLLVHETAGEDGPSARPQVRRVDSVLGRLTLAYRRRDAEADLLGEQSESERDRQLHDRFGRPVYLIEGIVVRGDRDLSKAHLEASLDAIRAETRMVFPGFWQVTDESTPPLPSSPIMVSARARRGLPTGLLIAGVVGALAYLASRLRRPSGAGREDRSIDRAGVDSGSRSGSDSD